MSVSNPTTAPLKGNKAPKASRVVVGSLIAALAVSHIGKWEGLRLYVYRDIIGIPTVCYGETRGIKMGQVFTKIECDEMFIKALQGFAVEMEACAPILAKERDTSPQFYVANLDMIYNIGAGAYCKSTLVRRVNANDETGACNEITKWVRAGQKKFVQGLFNRRLDTKDLCLRGRT